MKKIVKKPWEPQTIDLVSAVLLLLAVLLLCGSFFWHYIELAMRTPAGPPDNAPLKVDDIYR